MNHRLLIRPLLSLALFSSVFVAMVASPNAGALTKQQCVNRFQGKTTSREYRNSDCDKSKGGSCVLEQWGASPDAQAADCNNSHTPATPTHGSVSGDGCADIKTSVISCDQSGENPILNMMFEIVNFLAIGVGIAVVGGITWGALLYTTSNGDSGKAQQGITVIVNAVIGLLLFIFAYALINFLVPGGVF